MLRIRLTRTGKKNYAQYRIVVADSRRAVKGRFIERLGHYNPHTKELVIKKDAILSWINKGAQVTNTVAKLMEIEKITHSRVKVSTRPKRAPKKKEEKSAEKPVAPKSEEKENTVENEVVEEQSEVTKEEAIPENKEGEESKKDA